MEHAQACLSTVSIVKQWPYCHKIRLSENVKAAILQKLQSVSTVDELEGCEKEMVRGR